MFHKIKQFVMIALASSTLLVPTLAAVTVTAVSADSINGALCQGIGNAANGNNNGSATDCGTAGKGGNTDLSSIASKIVNIFSILVGITAVIFVIYGGFRYITSGGDSGSVGNAKNTLIYALVGLVIVALAQFIVHYVLNTATNAVSGQN